MISAPGGVERTVAVRNDFLRDAAMMLTAGTIIALPCVWGLGRLIEAQLVGIRPTDAQQSSLLPLCWSCPERERRSSRLIAHPA